MSKQPGFLMPSFRYLIFALTALVISAGAFAAQPANPMIPAKDFSLDQYRGHVVYLDFWASWCSPCKASFPFMEQLRSRYAADGLEVIAVNVDSEANAAQRFLAKQDTQFAVVTNPSGSLAERFKVLGMPSSYLIDANGKIIWQHRGFRSDDRKLIEQKVQQALTENKLASTTF